MTLFFTTAALVLVQGLFYLHFKRKCAKLQAKNKHLLYENFSMANTLLTVNRPFSITETEHGTISIVANEDGMKDAPFKRFVLKTYVYDKSDKQDYEYKRLVAEELVDKLNEQP